MTKHKNKIVEQKVDLEEHTNGYAPALYPTKQSIGSKTLSSFKSGYEKFHSSGFDILLFPTLLTLVFALIQYVVAKALYIKYFNLSQYLIGLNNVLFVFIGSLILDKLFNFNIRKKIYKLIVGKKINE